MIISFIWFTAESCTFYSFSFQFINYLLKQDLHEHINHYLQPNVWCADRKHKSWWRMELLVFWYEHFNFKRSISPIVTTRFILPSNSQNADKLITTSCIIIVRMKPAFHFPVVCLRVFYGSTHWLLSLPTCRRWRTLHGRHSVGNPLQYPVGSDGVDFGPHEQCGSTTNKNGSTQI